MRKKNIVKRFDVDNMQVEMIMQFRKKKNIIGIKKTLWGCGTTWGKVNACNLHLCNRKVFK